MNSGPAESDEPQRQAAAGWTGILAQLTSSSSSSSTAAAAAAAATAVVVQNWSSDATGAEM